MKFRWTIKELKEVDKSDFEMCRFIKAILEERKSELSNVYSPLYKRLRSAQSFIEVKIKCQN